MHEKVSQPVNQLARKIYDRKQELEIKNRKTQIVEQTKHIVMLDLLQTNYQ